MGPLQVRHLFDALYLFELVFGMIAYRRRKYGLGIAVLLRIFGKWLDRLDERTVVTGWLVDQALHKFLRADTLVKVHQWIGDVHLIGWGVKRPNSLSGSIFRYMYLLGRSVGFHALERAGLQKCKFPFRKQDITKEWIGNKIGCELEDFSLHELWDDNPRGFMGQTIRIDLTGQCPSYLIAKLPTSSFILKSKLHLLGVYLSEVQFYKECAPTMRGWKSSSKMLMVPRTLAAEYDDRGNNFIILMEHIPSLTSGNERRGASWCHACSVASRYARFHSLYWSNSLIESVYGMEWQKASNWNHPAILNMNMSTAFSDLMDQPRFAKHVPPKMQRLLRRLQSNIKMLLEELQEGPATIIHGDARMSNMLFPQMSGEEERYEIKKRVSFDDYFDRENINWLAIDWRSASKGAGVYDLAYFVGMDLEIDPSLGDSCDRILVQEYHKELSKCLKDNNKAIGSYGFDACWENYCLSMLLSCLFPIVIMRDEGSQAAREIVLKRCISALERLSCDRVLDNLLDRRCQGRFMTGSLQEISSADEIALASFSNSETGPLETCLTDADELMHHHTQQSILKFPNNDSAYDRWFLSGYDKEGKFFFATAFGVYPCRRIVDASFSVVFNGVQHNLRASRPLSESEWPLEQGPIHINNNCGPITITVLEPFQKVMLEIHMPGADGLSCSLTMTSRHAPVLDPHFNQESKCGPCNYYRMTQLVSWDGRITINDTHRIEVTDWWGVRDRSWGYLPLQTNSKSLKLLGIKPIRDIVSSLISSPQLYWIWIPVNLDNGGLTYLSQQSSTSNNCAAHVLGDPFEAASWATVNEEESSIGKVETAGHSIQYLKDTRHASKANVVFGFRDGRRMMVECTPLFPFFMSGIGYGHPEWGHGSNHGTALSVQLDKFKTEMVDRNHPLFWHVQEVSAVKVSIFSKEGKETPVANCRGIGAVEQLVVGAHFPSEFTGIYDV